MHGIAKGARRGGGKSTPTPLDRGLLLEALLYHRPNRELHTLGSLHVTNFFHGIRADITKSALRDIAIELYLKTITEPSPHPELFELLVDFFAGLDGVDNIDIVNTVDTDYNDYTDSNDNRVDTDNNVDTVDTINTVNTVNKVNTINAVNSMNDGTTADFISLWRFIGEYCEHTGFGIDTENHAGSGVDPRIVKIINGEEASMPRNRYSMGECINITEQLLRYCRRHFDIRSAFNSMEFVRGL